MSLGRCGSLLLFEIKGSALVQDSKNCAVPLSKTLYPLLSTCSTWDDRKTSIQD